MPLKSLNEIRGGANTDSTSSTGGLVPLSVLRQNKQESRMQGDANEQYQVGQQFPFTIDSPDLNDTRFRQEQQDSQALQQQQLNQDLTDRQQMDQYSRVSDSIPPVEKPWLARIQKDIYDNTLGPLTDKAMRFAASATQIGNSKELLKGNPITSGIFGSALDEPQTTADKATDVAGSLYGMLAGGEGAVLGAGKIAGKLAGKLSPKVIGALDELGALNGVYGSKVAGTLARGATAGALYGTGRELGEAATGQQQDLTSRLQDVGMDAALFGVGDVAAGALVPEIGNTYRAIRNAGAELGQAEVKPTLGTAVNDFIRRVDSSQPTIPTGRITQELPAPTYPREQQLADQFRWREDPTMARVETRTNPYAQRLNELYDVARQEQLPPGREREALEDIWSRMAGPQDPGLDQLIELATPTLRDMERRTPTRDLLSRAKETQYAREVAGAPLPVKSEYDRGLSFPSRAPLKGEIQPAPRPTLREAAQSLREEPPTLNRGVIPEPQTVDDILTVKEPRIRDRVYSYLDEAEKAAKERIKARGTRLSSTPIDEYADYAIIGAAKIGKGTIKFADFTEEMVKEFGEEVRPRMKEIYNRSVTVLKEAERRQSKEAQEARAFNTQATGDRNTFRGKVSRDVSRNRVPFAERAEQLRSTFTDDLAPLEGLEKRVRGKLNSAESSLYKSARLFRGMPAKANRIVIDRLSPIVSNIEKEGLTSKDLGDYALAVHARDVNARDIKSGFTDREIENVIQKYGTPKMEAARRELIKIGDDMLQELAEAGIVSDDLVSALRRRYPNYVPLFRNMDDEKVEFGRGLSDALANVTSPIKKLAGSERQVIDPLENMVKNIFQSVNAVERNKVAQQLARLADDDANQSFIRKLDDYEKVGRKNVVSVMQNGKKVQYEVEPEVYKAMLNLDKESSNLLIKILQKPASLLRAGATLTPEFSLRNPMRDVNQAFVVSKSGFNPIVDFPAGIFQAITKGRLYKQWVNEMGDFGNIVSIDRNSTNEALKTVLGEPVGKKFVNIVNGKSLIGVLRAIADTSESATKIGEFRAALRQGQTPQEAAYRSRDIMDFARAGTGVRQANKIVAFLNANIQGKSKLLRAVKENPVGFMARGFTSITVPTIGVFLMQKYMASDIQQKTIREAPEWQKFGFWLVPIPKTDMVARIPKPFDLNILFANLPEKALEYIFNNDKEAFDGFAKTSLSNMALPNQISGLLPFVEGMANYSFFRQGDIVPLGEAGREYKDQFDINTTETAKLLAAAANKLTGGEGAFKNFSSPRIMDNTLRGLTAGLGSYATSAIDVLLDKLNLTDNPIKPDKGAAQQPLARAFLVNPLQSGQSTEKLYNAREKLSKEKSSATLHKIKFDLTKAKELKFIEKQTEDMSDLTKRIRETENSRTLSSQEKRRLIDDYTRKRNNIASEAVKKLQFR